MQLSKERGLSLTFLRRGIETEPWGAATSGLADPNGAVFQLVQWI